jgi:murein DD-endopeptidase MepM/ murein hydrolase activator NlpD
MRYGPAKRKKRTAAVNPARRCIRKIHVTKSARWSVFIRQVSSPHIDGPILRTPANTGIDLGAPSGTAIRAAEDGRVASTGYDNIYGNYTLIAHGDGMTTFYAHQLVKIAKKGEMVKRGETIGKVGSTGWSTGPHLHFEVRINGDPWDPMGWFGNRKMKVACAG